MFVHGLGFVTLGAGSLINDASSTQMSSKAIMTGKIAETQLLSPVFIYQVYLESNFFNAWFPFHIEVHTVNSTA